MKDRLRASLLALRKNPRRNHLRFYCMVTAEEAVATPTIFGSGHKGAGSKSRVAGTPSGVRGFSDGGLEVSLTSAFAESQGGRATPRLIAIPELFTEVRRARRDRSPQLL